MAASSHGPMDIRSTLVGLCQVGKTLTKHAERVLQQLVEAMKHHLRQRCFSLLREGADEAVLYSYSADATPLRCATTKVHTTAGGQVTRKGRVLEEFLLQRGLFKTKLPTGEDRMTFLFTDILPLSAGKKAANIFVAQNRFFPLLRKAGHAGICLQHSCSDRALFSSLDRMLRQRVSAYYTPGVGPALGDQAELLELTDWVLGCGCAAHDVHNAMKWSVSFSTTPEDIQTLHIIVEALWNSFEILLSRLPAFLTKYLSFAESSSDDLESVGSFWRNMGVEADMIDLLVEVNPWWEAGRLTVNQSLAQDAEGIEKVSHVLLYLCKWRQYCDSRWCTIGACCRSLVWGLCIGLEAWVAMARADPSASDFHLHGFAKLTWSIKRYCVVAGIAAYAPDAVLAEILIDDRLVRSGAKVEDLLADEALWIESIETFTWQRLASLLGERQEAWELRHRVVHSCHIAAAFIHERVLGQLKEYPWRLAVGDVRANLDELSASDEPIRDSCAHKIRLLLRMGFNRERLASAVELMREVPWSAVPVEQAHASAAVLHRYHPGYSAEALATRATLHQCRHFFLEPPETAKQARESKRILALQRKAPKQVSGKHAFLAHLMSVAKEGMPSGGKLPSAMVRRIVKEHNSLFLALPLEAQAAFHREAQERSEEKAKALGEDLQHLQAAARLAKARLDSELLAEGVLNRVPLAKFTADDFHSLQQLAASPEFSQREVSLRRLEAFRAPEAPSADKLDVLNKCPIYAAPPPERVLPEWLKRFCWNRDLLQERGVAVTTSLDDGAKAFYFLFATQKPMSPHFKVLTLKAPPVQCCLEASPHDMLEAWSASNLYEFTDAADEYAEGSCLPCLSGDGVLVLQGLSFHTPGSMVTNLEPVSLESFLHGLPAKVREPKPKSAEARASKAAPPDLEALYPWLAEGSQEPSTSGAQGSQTEGPQGPELPLGAPSTVEDVLNRVWDGLEAKRQEWSLQGTSHGEDFTVCVSDWAWTAAQQGKAYYNIVAQAAKGDPASWCRRYQLKPQVSFSVRLYGERAANAFAVEWCARMQFFYSLYRAQPSRDFAYAPEHKQAYSASQGFVAIQSELPLAGKAAERAHAIEALFPILK
jgi:hypothetical protein